MEALQYFFEVGRKEVLGKMEEKRRCVRSRGTRETWGFSAVALHGKRWTAGSAVSQAAI